MAIEAKMVQQVWANALLNKWCNPSELHVVAISPNVETASWSYKNNCHHINIGQYCDDSEGLQSTEELVSGYLCHELAHAQYTIRDFKHLGNVLENYNVPFGLFNIAEDARAEHLYRLDMNRFFKWADIIHEDVIEDNIDNPLYLLDRMIYFEGGVPVCDSLSHNLVNKVYSYYLRFISCNDSLSVIPVLNEFMDEFNLDVGSVIKLLNDADLESDLGSPRFSLRTKYIIVDNDNANDDAGQNERTDELWKNEMFFSEDTDFEVNVSNHDLDNLKKAFAVKSRYMSTSIPSKRLNTKNIVRGVGENIYRRKMDISKKVINVNLIIDCSGSMHHEALDYAKELACMFGVLAQSNILKGCVILTNSYGSYSFDLKDPNVLIPQIDINIGCAEGLKQCFDDNLMSMKNADINFVITDGDLADEPISKNYYRLNGVITFGLYVGSRDDVDLLQWFDYGVSRDSVFELLTEMVRVLKRIALTRK